MTVHQPWLPRTCLLPAGRQWSLSRLLSLSWDPNKAHVDPSTPRGGRAPVSPSSRWAVLRWHVPGSKDTRLLSTGPVLSALAGGHPHMQRLPCCCLPASMQLFLQWHLTAARPLVRGAASGVMGKALLPDISKVLM